MCDHYLPEKRKEGIWAKRENQAKTLIPLCIVAQGFRLFFFAHSIMSEDSFHSPVA
jgi:hypothetical protein